MIEAACTPGWSQKYHHFANLTGDAIRSQLHGGESSCINVYISQHRYQAEKIRIQKQKKGIQTGAYHLDFLCHRLRRTWGLKELNANNRLS